MRVRVDRRLERDEGSRTAPGVADSESSSEVDEGDSPPPQACRRKGDCVKRPVAPRSRVLKFSCPVDARQRPVEDGVDPSGRAGGRAARRRMSRVPACRLSRTSRVRIPRSTMITSSGPPTFLAPSVPGLAAPSDRPRRCPRRLPRKRSEWAGNNYFVRGLDGKDRRHARRAESKSGVPRCCRGGPWRPAAFAARGERRGCIILLHTTLHLKIHLLKSTAIN